MIFSGFKSGLQVIMKNKGMILAYYLINLLFGVIVMIPTRAALTDAAGYSLMGERLAGTLDIDFLFEFILKNSTATSLIVWLVAAAGIFYAIANLWLSGGVYGLLTASERYSAARFGHHASRYFARYVRLALWSIPVFGVLFCVQFLEAGIVRIVWGADPYQYITFWGGWIKLGLGYIGILSYLLVLDYARIIIAATDERKSRKAVWKGLKFVLKHFLTTFGLTSLLLLLGIVMLMVYNPVADALHAPAVLMVLLLFVLQQCYTFLRMGLRLTLYASQVEVYKATQASVDTDAATSPGLAPHPA